MERSLNWIDTFTIRELGFISWKEQLYYKVKKQLLPSVLQQITRDRKGEKVDHSMPFFLWLFS